MSGVFKESGLAGGRIDMKKVLITLIVIIAVPLAVFAQDAPEVRVSDGKVSITALSIPLGRLLDLLDKAVGMKSQVKPELTNRVVSVRFTNLELKDAVHKIFEDGKLNYFLIEGKGIRVVDQAAGGTSTGSTSSPFPDSQPIVNSQPIAIGNPQPLPGPTPVAQPNQPNQPNNPFGNQPAAQPANTPSPGAAFVPGQLPPPIGASNPLVTPANTPAPAVGFPATTPPPAQPAGPGALPSGPGALPGATVTPGQIGR
jgi:hypothetical protein